MRAPLGFTYGNCLFAEDKSDAWAAFAVEVTSYEWLSDDGKHARFLALLGALEAIEADVQLLRVGLGPDRERGTGVQEAHAAARAHATARAAYAREHARRLVELGGEPPALFVLVSLREPERDVATHLSNIAERGPRGWWKSLSQD